MDVGRSRATVRRSAVRCCAIRCYAIRCYGIRCYGIRCFGIRGTPRRAAMDVGVLESRGQPRCGFLGRFGFHDGATATSSVAHGADFAYLRRWMDVIALRGPSRWAALHRSWTTPGFGRTLGLWFCRTPARFGPLGRFRRWCRLASARLGARLRPRLLVRCRGFGPAPPAARRQRYRALPDGELARVQGIRKSRRSRWHEPTWLGVVSGLAPRSAGFAVGRGSPAPGLRRDEPTGLDEAGRFGCGFGFPAPTPTADPSSCSSTRCALVRHLGWSVIRRLPARRAWQGPVSHLSHLSLLSGCTCTNRAPP
ncbi:hypothetical protein BKA25_002082 [Actinoalloteichus hymeniacidonis]|uniref:Uncharacterized protein n=1 Tax=Actinoalloteichus hymeniacidonis TaxID=340345 RepID=A0AAC9HR91_9PSEU|nr:hypothetical protein TL08_16835 [Actinoalloteichus hymeniacidonis]MBB5907766.1 hypothetical protein [Actinoalloteichus hymeniacidonis]